MKLVETHTCFLWQLCTLSWCERVCECQSAFVSVQTHNILFNEFFKKNLFYEERKWKQNGEKSRKITLKMRKCSLKFRFFAFFFAFLSVFTLRERLILPVDEGEAIESKLEEKSQKLEYATLRNKNNTNNLPAIFVKNSSAFLLFLFFARRKNFMWVLTLVRGFASILSISHVNVNSSE